MIFCYNNTFINYNLKQILVWDGRALPALGALTSRRAPSAPIPQRATVV